MVVRASNVSKPYNRRDPFYRRAKQEGYRARSAFKIDEILKRFNVLRKGASVLDLGAAPGGFLQILAGVVGPQGRITGVDVVAIPPLGLSQVKTAQLDVMEADFFTRLDELVEGRFDAVISDLAPKTTGIRSTDEARSLALAHRALEVAVRRGRLGSTLIAKAFMGGDFEAFCSTVQAEFEKVKVVRPEASRARSFEAYVVALNKKPR